MDNLHKYEIVSWRKKLILCKRDAWNKEITNKQRWSVIKTDKITKKQDWIIKQTIKTYLICCRTVIFLPDFLATILKSPHADNW